MKKIVKLLKRNPKKNKPRILTPVYDICLVKKSARGRYVFEKLGVYTQRGHRLNINLFRLVFWISKNVSFTGNVIELLLRHNILNSLFICDQN